MGDAAARAPTRARQAGAGQADLRGQRAQ